MFAAALIGFLCGFIGSIPVAGPIAILVLGRGIEDRVRSGLYLALGAAIAEGAYAYLAFWGFSAVLGRYAWFEPATRAIAAIILTALGVRFLRKPYVAPEFAEPADPTVGNKRSFVLGFTITALNPTLLATWPVVVTLVYSFVASFHIVRFDAGSALPFSAGAGIGIMSWYATLLRLLGRFRGRFSGFALHRLLRGMGGVLVALGIVFAWRFTSYVLAH